MANFVNRNANETVNREATRPYIRVVFFAALLVFAFIAGFGFQKITPEQAPLDDAQIQVQASLSSPYLRTCQVSLESLELSSSSSSSLLVS